MASIRSLWGPAMASASFAIRSHASLPYSPKPIVTSRSVRNIAPWLVFRESRPRRFGCPNLRRLIFGSVKMPSIDLAKSELRSLNQALHALSEGSNETSWDIQNPQGAHAVAVGV